MSGPPATREIGSPSFDDVAERMAPQLYRIAVSLCRNPDEAQDLMQDTLLQAHRKWDQFEGRSDPGTWLYTIAARLCRRRHRRRAGQPTTIESLDELLPQPDDPVVDLSALSALSDPARAFDREEIRRAVSSAIAALPPAFRLPLVLVDIAELRLSEVATILGVKEATVKTRVHRARLKLRKVLVSRLPIRTVSPDHHDRQVCLDLLHAKQEALDRQLPFSMSDHALCERCASVFATLDLGCRVCRTLAASEPAAG